MDLAVVRTLLAQDPSQVAVFFDFDGTLAPIVSEPSVAVASPGAMAMLVQLVARVGRVAVISGRPLSFLAAQLPDAVDLSGVYGIEERVAGVVREHPDASHWRAVVASAVASAQSSLTGITVETKGVSLTAHFRTSPAREAEVVAWATAAGAETGLLVRRAKASVELHPPIPVDKGTAVRAFAAGFSTVVFVGDDLGDLPAFGALDDLARAGVRTVKIVVGGPELPPSVAAAADVVVADPAAVVTLFS